MLGTESAVMQLAVDEVEMDKVAKLQHYPDLLDALDNWILFPDHALIPRLVRLAEVVNRVYPQPKQLQVYRGFDLNGIQDSLGIKGLPHVGQVVHYAQPERALSFTRKLEMAQAFGGVVISVQLDPKKVNYLDITPELCYLVSKARNLSEIETQHEVVLLPPTEFQGVVVQSKKSKFSWLGW